MQIHIFCQKSFCLSFYVGKEFENSHLVFSILGLGVQILHFTPSGYASESNLQKLLVLRESSPRVPGGNFRRERPNRIRDNVKFSAG